MKDATDDAHFIEDGEASTVSLQFIDENAPEAVEREANRKAEHQLKLFAESVRAFKLASHFAGKVAAKYAKPYAGGGRDVKKTLKYRRAFNELHDLIYPTALTMVRKKTCNLG